MLSSAPLTESTVTLLKSFKLSKYLSAFKIEIKFKVVATLSNILDLKC